MIDPYPGLCDHCGSEDIFRVFDVPMAIIDNKQPRNIGELADRNTEKMVKRGHLPKSALNAKENRIKKIQKQRQQKELSKLTPKQKEGYIMTGRTN